MRFLRHSLTGLFLAALALGMVAYAALMVMGAVQERMAEDSRPSQARERVFAVAVQTAEVTTQTPIMTAYGQINAQRSLELRAATSGRVISLNPAFVDGGVVKQGQVLLQVDPAVAQAAVDRAGADLADAIAEVRDANAGLQLARDELSAAEEQASLQERALARAQDLLSRGVGTAAAVETAEFAAATSRQAVLVRRQALTQADARISQSSTRLTRAQIALREAERDLADTTITAPFSGTLSEVNLVEGRLVTNNEKLATLIDPGALDVSFRLSTAQYARLLSETGDLTALPVSVALDVSGINLEATGRISRDSAAVNAAQSGRLVYAALGSAAGFKPGDFVTVGIEEPPLTNVIRLPASALNGSQTVLALKDGDRLEALPIKLERRQGNDVLIRGRGLEGREIVLSRTPLLGAGVQVRAIRPAGQAEPEEPQMIELSQERRAKLIAFVESNKRMPAEAKERVLARLAEPMVSTRMVERIESRMGG